MYVLFAQHIVNVDISGDLTTTQKDHSIIYAVLLKRNDFIAGGGYQR